MNINAFFKISYGLYLISTKAGDKMGGYVANTAFQVTAKPARFAISCNRDNLTAEMIRESGVFAFSVLREDASSELIGNFGYKSGRDIDKFNGVNYITAKSGAPIVTDSSVAWFDCKVTETHEIGTHILFIGEVLDYDVIDEEANPLTYAYYHEVRKGLSPKNAPTYIEKEKLEEEKTEQPVEEASAENETWTCQVCHYNYDPEEGDPITGIPPGTAFEDLPDDWVCPLCGATKDMFEKD